MKIKLLLATVVATLALGVSSAPAAQARWLPDNPFESLPFASTCVPQKDLSFSLRVVARRVFGSPVCIPKIRYRVSSAAQAAAGYKLGQYWCLVANMRPGAPLGTILSWVSAARFCGKYGRGWRYVYWK